MAGCRVGMLAVADPAPRGGADAHTRAAAALSGLAQLLAIEEERAAAGEAGELGALVCAPAALDAPHLCVKVGARLGLGGVARRAYAEG